jgi:peptidoglycan/LPS O-acetylase OafA/YrhL
VAVIPVNRNIFNSQSTDSGTKDSPGFSYRPDIDGLRALAVIPVILFHTGLSGISGGFVGVDIFFVISGFLITYIITADIDKQRFSILSFYERRIRRIFPALFAVLLFTIVVASILFLPKPYQDFGKSVTAADFFVSNIFFWRETGYFDAPVETKPLLHTWSLAVEEQFYLFFPLFLVFISRYAKNRLITYTTIILVLSLALSAWGAYYKPTSTFYLAPTRAWELMLGALLAMGVLRPLNIKWARETLAVTGLCLIGWSIVMFSTSTPFPGLNALYPCIGATLLIYTGTNERTVVSRLLGTRLFVLIGLISYSLYLWHWPVIVFVKYYEIEPLTARQVTVLLLAVLMISTLSWKYIECPFRKKNAIFPRKDLFVVSGTAMIAFGTIGSAIAVTHGWPERLMPKVQAIAAEEYDRNPESTRCRDKLPADIKSGNICLIGAKDKTPPAFLVWGDSHADAFSPSLNDAAQSYGLSGWLVAYGGCPPLVGMGRINDLAPCAELGSATMEFIASHKIKNVILVAWWPMYTEKDGKFIDTTRKHPQEDSAKTVFARAFDRTLSKLHELGVTVDVIAPVPGAKMHVPSAIARSVQYSKNIDIFVTKADYLSRNKWLLSLFDYHSAEISKIIYPHKLLCGKNQLCRVTDNKNTPLYFDGAHLTVAGARFLDTLVRELFAAM